MHRYGNFNVYRVYTGNDCFWQEYRVAAKDEARAEELAEAESNNPHWLAEEEKEVGYCGHYKVYKIEDLEESASSEFCKFEDSGPNG